MAASAPTGNRLLVTVPEACEILSIGRTICTDCIGSATSTSSSSAELPAFESLIWSGSPGWRHEPGTPGARPVDRSRHLASRHVSLAPDGACASSLGSGRSTVIDNSMDWPNAAHQAPVRATGGATDRNVRTRCARPPTRCPEDLH